MSNTLAQPTPAKRNTKRRSPARKDALMRRFADTAGREGMVAMLQFYGEARAQRLLELLFDPAYKRHSFASLCERAGLTITDLLDLFRRYHLDQAILAMSLRAPEVFRANAEDAQSHDEECPRCEGTKVVSRKQDGVARNCPECDGTGTVRIPGNHQAQQLFFKVMGLIR